MKNYKMTIQYDGTDYEGWQSQKRKGSVTIQETLEAALCDLFQRPTKLIGAGRTDSGVHAEAQVANFHTESGIAPYKMVRALNVRLPEDISVLSIEEAAEDFHARIWALGKHYRYTIYADQAERVLWSRYFYQTTYALSEEKIRLGCAKLCGMHDFRAFCAAGSEVEDKHRNVYDVRLLRKDHWWILDFYGEGFLRNMVRIMAGTLLEIGTGQLPLENIDQAFATGERNLLGQTLPAKGLCLKKVFYPR